MRIFLLILVLVTLQNAAKASEVSVDLKSSDKMERAAINGASETEIKVIVACIKEAGETHVDETACVNDVLGDVQN